MSTETVKKHRDIRKEVTDRIITMLEEGTVPWRKPWDDDKAGFDMPQNGMSKRPYRGINSVLLMCHPAFVETGDPRFFTFKQIKEMGASLEKGTKGVKVVYFKKIEVENENSQEGEEETKVIPMLKDYTVFHASQVKDCPEYEPTKIEQPEWQKPLRVKATLDASGADIRIGGQKAYYQPANDYIQLPPEQSFESEAGWASTGLHELAHWTGHAERLNRDLSGNKASPEYAKEELRAELASVFLCAELGISPELEQHASYLDGWLENLKNDKTEIFRAASDAQKISDYVMDFVPELKTTEELAEDLPDHMKQEMGIEEGIADEIPFDVGQPRFGGPAL